MKPEPVRKIGVTRRSISGVVPGIGRYESALERDLMEILRFERHVRECIPQPLTITYHAQNGDLREYTPDGLIHFTDDMMELPILYEVKYRADFRADWKSLMPKFRAAKRYCEERHWRFAVFTEREIRTPYLENARFLTRYRDLAVHPAMIGHVMDIMWDLLEADPELLLAALCRDKSNQGEMIPVMWHLVSNGFIGCDLDVPLTMHSTIWPIQEVM